MLIPILATETFSNGDWIALGSLLFIGAGIVVGWVRKSERREVTFAGTPVDKKEFEAQIMKTDAELLRIHERIDDTASAADQAREHLRAELSVVRESVSAIRATSEMTVAIMTGLNSKLDRVMEKMKLNNDPD